MADKKSEKLVINMPNKKFYVEPNQIFHIENCRIKMGSSPDKKLDISGDIKELENAR